MGQKARVAGYARLLPVILLIYELGSLVVKLFHLTSIFTASLTMSASKLCLTLPVFHPLLSFTPPLSLLILSFIVFHRRFFRDLCCSVWLQRYRLQRGSSVGEDAVACSSETFLSVLSVLHSRIHHKMFLSCCSLSSFCPSRSPLFFLSPLLYSHLFQDVDTIYHSQDNREFNLLDFSHLDSRWHTLLQTSGMIPNMEQLKFGC